MCGLRRVQYKSNRFLAVIYLSIECGWISLSFFFIQIFAIVDTFSFGSLMRFLWPNPKDASEHFIFIKNEKQTIYFISYSHSVDSKQKRKRIESIPSEFTDIQHGQFIHF